MYLDGDSMNELLVSIKDGAILREYNAPPHNLGWFRSDGSEIDYPARETVNALLHLGCIKPWQRPGANGGEFTAYKLTDKGLRYADIRGRNVASASELFWAIVCEQANGRNAYFYIGTTAPDLSQLIESDFNSGDAISISCHETDEVPSDALLLQDDQLEGIIGGGKENDYT